MANSQFEFRAMPGWFVQDETAMDDQNGGWDYTDPAHNFGLLPPLSWPELTKALHELNSQAETAPDGRKKKQYKLLYAARHGEGEHNVAEAQYGTEAWNDYWSKLTTDGTLYWADAHLTATGEAQARRANEVFGRQFSAARMPEPQLWWTSPLWRCLQTASLSWRGLGEIEGLKTFVIKEMLRERMGEHTCDRRSRREEIEEVFGLPGWRFEPGFKEGDELWEAERREDLGEVDARMRLVLEDLFEGVDGGDGAEVELEAGDRGGDASSG
ncbi:hypothetical protein MBLNU230_g3982t1 [Neophaeotheca triangularis]